MSFLGSKPCKGSSQKKKLTSLPKSSRVHVIYLSPQLATWTCSTLFSLDNCILATEGSLDSSHPHTFGLLLSSSLCFLWVNITLISFSNLTLIMRFTMTNVFNIATCLSYYLILHIILKPLSSPFPLVVFNILSHAM